MATNLDSNNSCIFSLAAARKKLEEIVERPPPPPASSSSPAGGATAAAVVAPAPLKVPPQKMKQKPAPPPPPLPVPEWILGLISNTFFGPCPRHGPGGTATTAASGEGGAGGAGGKGSGGGGSGGAETTSSSSHSSSTKKTDLTHWCCACLRPLCAACIQEREHPAGHRLQQVRGRRGVGVGSFFSVPRGKEEKKPPRLPLGAASRLSDFFVCFFSLSPRSISLSVFLLPSRHCRMLLSDPSLA